MTEERRKGERRNALAPIAEAIAKALTPSARIFAHPRCAGGPAFGAMAAGLEAQGFDFTSVRLFGAFHNKHELVRQVKQDGAVTTYERMDGVQFKHRMGRTAPEPEMA